MKFILYISFILLPVVGFCQLVGNRGMGGTSISMSGSGSASLTNGLFTFTPTTLQITSVNTSVTRPAYTQVMSIQDFLYYVNFL